MSEVSRFTFGKEGQDDDVAEMLQGLFVMAGEGNRVQIYCHTHQTHTDLTIQDRSRNLVAIHCALSVSLQDDTTVVKYYDQVLPVALVTNEYLDMVCQGVFVDLHLVASIVSGTIDYLVNEIGANNY